MVHSKGQTRVEHTHEEVNEICKQAKTERSVKAKGGEKKRKKVISRRLNSEEKNVSVPDVAF